MKIQYGVTVKIKRGGDNGSENGSDDMEETEDIMSSSTEYLQSWIGCLEQAIDELEKKYDSLVAVHLELTRFMDPTRMVELALAAYNVSQVSDAEELND